jgi:hypothetical protein
MLMLLKNNELENSFQADTYYAYMTKDDSKYLVTKPESGICPLPLGPDNAPVVEINNPTNGKEYKQGTNMTITGEVRVLETISSFSVSIDGNSISGASVNEDGTYSVTYSIPSGMSTGNHTIQVQATDNYGKSDTESRSFKVVANSSSVSISAPSSGASVNSFPVNLQATVSGVATTVKFVVTKDGGGYSSGDILAVPSGSNTWSTSWNDNSGGNGDYTITVTATIAGNTYSDSISITVE